MPELPEVETVARQLHPLIKGTRVVVCRTYDPKLRLSAELLKGAEVRRGFRRGKFVVFELADSRGRTSFLAVHLRMTGRLLWTDSAADREARKYLRAELELNRGSLLFCDARRFGTMEIFATEAEIPVRGVDPTAELFTLEGLRSMLKGRRQPMKLWLMRQDLLTGVGNIYASEILFRARISPRRTAARVRPDEVPLLFRSIREVLSSAIKHCGTTFSDFQDARGTAGGFERFLRVYGRKGEPCRRCKTPIKRIVQGQRSTFFCPNCQK